MRTETSAQTYVRDLEEHLQHTLFGGAASDPEGAVLLIRGALANGDQTRAELLALETARLAGSHRQDKDMAVAAVHAAGLVGRDPAALEGAAAGYSSLLASAWATEDAGLAWAQRGSKARAAARLREAHALYERIGSAEGMARVRSRLREDGVRLRHWTPADRPAFGWDSLTDTEQQVVELVADGLSNREVASRMFLSLHTVAFHLRHVFWKLGVSSRCSWRGCPPSAPRSRRPTNDHPTNDHPTNDHPTNDHPTNDLEDVRPALADKRGQRRIRWQCSLVHRRTTMARLPARSGGRNMTLINPTREFEDIYDRMGQLVNVAFGDVAHAPSSWRCPGSPLADLSETDDASWCAWSCPACTRTRSTCELQDREVVITGEVADEQQGRRHRS